MSDLMMELSETMNVVGPMQFLLKPGGVYTYDIEKHSVESNIVELTLLAHFCKIMCAAESVNGDCAGFKFRHEIFELAHEVFEAYAPFFAAGVDILSFKDFYRTSDYERYAARPVVGCELNAGPNERTEGLPEGWWYDFPCHAYKTFSLGKICVDEDVVIRVGLYPMGDNENEHCLEMIEITERGNYSRIVKQWPSHSTEIITACEFIYSQNHI